MEPPLQSLLFTPSRSAVHSPGTAFEDSSALRPPRTGGPVSTPGVQSHAQLSPLTQTLTRRDCTRVPLLEPPVEQERGASPVSWPQLSSTRARCSDTSSLCRACPGATGAPARGPHRPLGRSSTWCVLRSAAEARRGTTLTPRARLAPRRMRRWRRPRPCRPTPARSSHLRLARRCLQDVRPPWRPGFRGSAPADFTASRRVRDCRHGRSGAAAARGHGESSLLTQGRLRNPPCGCVTDTHSRPHVRKPCSTLVQTARSSSGVAGTVIGRTTRQLLARRHHPAPGWLRVGQETLVHQ